MSRFVFTTQAMYDEFMNYYKYKLDCIKANVPMPKPCDAECIRRARQYTFDTSRKYMRSKPRVITEDIQRGLDLLRSNSRFQNKTVVAEIKAKNNEIKKRNRELQKISRAYLRETNLALVYDFTRWDRVPRRIYEEATYQPILKSMNNPIIKWVINTH